MSDQKRSDIVKKIQDFIAKGEANRGYNSYNKYKKRPNRSGKGGKLYSPKDLKNIDFSKLTVKEVMERQKDGVISDRDFFAVGRYQFIPNTLKDAFEWASKKGLVSEDDKFDAKTQDKLFEYLISKEKRPNLAAYISGESMDKSKAMQDLAQEWASVPVMKDTKKGKKTIKKGSSYYSDGVNKAHIKTNAVDKLFKNIDKSLLHDYKPFPSEVLKEDNLVMADKKGDSFFKKLVQQEAQKEIKEKEKSYDDMKFSDAFEEAMKDKGEGEVFKYKGKDILLKRAEPEIKKEPVKEKSYDDMKFSDAFEQAMKDKGEGEVFKHRGRDILLKRAEPKVEEKKPMDFQSLVKEYASKEIEPVEELDQGYNMDNIKDSQRVELVDRENELEKLLKQRAAFAHGGRKYQDAGFGESIEEPESIDNKPTLRDPFAPKSLEAQDIKEDMELAAEEDKTMVDTDPDVLPEEPEDKPEALTMDTLEQRFKDLMKSSKKERQTAAWATAASQIASMIDRASANPIGIKPINFQAGDASAEAKDLLALGRMKGLGVDRSMTEYQKAALKERQEDRKLAREKLKALALKAPKQDLTEAEKAVDKAYAKEYSDYIAAGGSKTAESDINKLDELAKEMKDNKDIFTGPLDTAVEYLGGFDTVRAAVNPKLQDIKSRLEQIVQQDLRTTLGAQFTEKEGKQFLERSFDPKLGYEENKKRLDDFIKMVKSRANARMKSAKYFEDKGTLKGFKGTESVGESATSDTVLLEAPNGQRKRVKRSAMQKYLDKGAKVVGE